MKSFYLFKKDLSSELRTRYAINSLAMFIIVAISVILFSLGEQRVNINLSSGLFWVVIFFSAMSGLSRTFVSEEERGTALTLQLTASPSTVLLGKMYYNLVLTFSMNTAIAFLYSILFQEFIIYNYVLFLSAFILGNIGLSAASTIIAAIIAKAGAKGTLYPVLSFPILLPLILICVQLTLASLEGELFENYLVELLIILCYDIMMISAGFILFDFIWKD